jgi:hypothetical protein
MYLDIPNLPDRSVAGRIVVASSDRHWPNCGRTFANWRAFSSHQKHGSPLRQIAFTLENRTSRARGYIVVRIASSHAVKSRNRIELGRFTYDARRRLGLCSNERGGVVGGIAPYKYAANSPAVYIDPGGLDCEKPTVNLILKPQVVAQVSWTVGSLPQPADRTKVRTASTFVNFSTRCSCEDCGECAPCNLVTNCEISAEFFIVVDIDSISDRAPRVPWQKTLGHEQLHVRNFINWFSNTFRPIIENVLLSDDCDGRFAALDKALCDARSNDYQSRMKRLWCFRYWVEADHPSEPGVGSLHDPMPGSNLNPSPTGIPPWVKQVIDGNDPCGPYRR